MHANGPRVCIFELSFSIDAWFNFEGMKLSSVYISNIDFVIYE
jgi:hypothetical protein